jgi:DNA-binding transcriptional LysR family regulator
VDLRQLEYVVAIARTGSFTRAAAECHVSQSALSHQVARLEAQLGVRLFVRSGRSVAPTEAGRLLQPYAVRAIAEVDSMQTALAALSGQVRGRVRLGLTQTAERLFSLTRHVADFRRSNPTAVVSMTLGPTSELVEAVAADELDLAYAAAPGGPVPGGIEFRALVDGHPLVAVAARGAPGPTQDEAVLRDLLVDAELIEFAPASALRRRTRQLLSSGTVHRREAVLALGSLAEMVRFASAGLGVAVVPRVFTDGHALRGLEPAPRVIRLLDPGASLDFGVYSRDQPMSPAVRAFALLTASAGS